MSIYFITDFPLWILICSAWVSCIQRSYKSPPVQSAWQVQRHLTISWPPSSRVILVRGAAAMVYDLPFSSFPSFMNTGEHCGGLAILVMMYFNGHQIVIDTEEMFWNSKPLEAPGKWGTPVSVMRRSFLPFHKKNCEVNINNINHRYVLYI